MTLWHALFLGIIQGLTEFLPISSSGHLALGQYFLGFEQLQRYVLFDLVCHLGTLLAILITFLPALKAGFFSDRTLFRQVAIATLPLFPLVMIIKPLKALFDQPWLWGPCFLVSAAILFMGLHWQFPSRIKPSSWRDPLAIGVMQAIAIFPGISRSGSTISAARVLGWPKEQAMQFSFLLAIPAILGGVLWEGGHAWNQSALSISLPWEAFAVGFLASFLVGMLSLRLLAQLLRRDKWNCFAWYCLVLGVTVTGYFNG